MTRCKGKPQKSSLKLGAGIGKDVKGATERAPAVTIDVKSAAAMPEFNAADPLAHVAGKRVATTTGMKTAFAAESSLNIARRIRNASVPCGCVIEDDAAVAEDLSTAAMDLSSSSRRLMPRRPAWSYEISSGRLHHREAQSFKKWLDEVQELIQQRGGYPPAFETNLQVWRQLWRVLERCHVAVVVLDARHPLLHLPPALIYHVRRTLQKPLVVVLNKLDAVDPMNAERWAEALSLVPGISAIIGYSKEELTAEFRSLRIGKKALIHICHKVHSESMAASKAAESSNSKVEGSDRAETVEEKPAFDFVESPEFVGSKSGYYFGTGNKGTGYYSDAQAPKKCAKAATRDLRDAVAQSTGEELSVPAGCIMLGLVGHPNVGKSSMVNHLMGGKVVSVKATPGHTKILQTIKLDDKTCLCDSPGVVFPRLEVPREAQIVGMLVPLAQVREPFSAIRWVMDHSSRPLPELLGLKPVTLRRVRDLLEAGLESLRLDLVDTEEDKDVVPWSPMLVCAQLAAQRGFMHSGRPDCMKAGTEIVERVLQGRIAYSVAPEEKAQAPKQGDSESESDWNACDDAEFESEEEAEAIGDRDLLELFGEEARGIGRSSKAAIKRFRRKQKLAEIAGEADPARTLRPYAGRLKEVGPEAA
mmetsp:Transcript_93580/g.222467  ORF Transcript_93580/g.222467 Transcript_93580/m.222467 type:complete len:645 (+) Transcript_93580:99-2033(+)|eukprot:CAMPEP_0181435556 /NCGR_PEP_ID=MMETSP1110-20121109/20394_1 /TAXON_ID=174948 /ORGANISM="Symbiodinium sp., Strain CCMP421" /LENGTH=644 /DNA_ID=CAMNT_0023559095 /DNA_START=99 /DNA_END=2030 /DNA_ORIENTATION=+